MTNISFITPELRRIDSADVETLALFRFNGKKPFTGISSLVDWRLYGHLSNLVIEGFLNGDATEALLMPLERHLAPDCLLILGLGDEEEFSKRIFFDGVQRLFKKIDRLNKTSVALALPGRVEGVCDATLGIEWFLECFENFSDGEDVRVIETADSQKAMAPILERWRLRQLVP